MMETVRVIGAGLAGCEAAWQLAERGFAVTLYEMKPQKMSPAHHSPDFAELVCSNSLGGWAASSSPARRNTAWRQAARWRWIALAFPAR